MGGKERGREEKEEGEEEEGGEEGIWLKALPDRSTQAFPPPPTTRTQ